MLEPRCFLSTSSSSHVMFLCHFTGPPRSNEKQGPFSGACRQAPFVWSLSGPNLLCSSSVFSLYKMSRSVWFFFLSKTSILYIIKDKENNWMELVPSHFCTNVRAIFWKSSSWGPVTLFHSLSPLLVLFYYNKPNILPRFFFLNAAWNVSFTKFWLTLIAFSLVFQMQVL